MYDAVVISDLHLGSDNCQAKTLLSFLERLRPGDLDTRRLVLNGDVFDSIDFRRLKKHHWRILSKLRKLSDTVEILWVHGNHDGPAEAISHLLGVSVHDEVTVPSGGRTVLFLHGHRFDEFIERYPLTSRLADWVYRVLQWVDKSHTIARTAKAQSKTFLRCVQKVQDSSVAYARKRGYAAVCCGHTHQPMRVEQAGVLYVNSGCWTEHVCHYLTVRDGAIELHEYRGEAAAPEEGTDAVPVHVAPSLAAA